MRILYTLLALVTVALAVLAGTSFLRQPRLEWGIYTLAGLAGCGLTASFAIRAWRGRAVDDRLLFMWGFSFAGIRSLFHYAEKGDTVSLVYGIIAGAISLGALVAFLRHPAPPAPEPKEPEITGPLNPQQKDVLGCAPWGGLLLLIGSAAGYAVSGGGIAIPAVVGALGVALLLSGLLRSRS